MFPENTLLILGSVTAVSAVALTGVAFLAVNHRLLKMITPVLVSFSAGALLGDVFIHILPEMAEDGATETAWLIVLGGILASFILEKFIHWHHCHMSSDCEEHYHPVGTMNLVGDLMHNAIDGVLIAGSYLAGIEVGIATTVAVLLHEIPQEISDVGVLMHSGYSRGRAVLFNALTGLTAIGGAIIVVLAGTTVEAVPMFLVPFAAGNFLYIAGSDLIPELHKETAAPKSLLQLAGILAGIAFMFALTVLE